MSSEHGIVDGDIDVRSPVLGRLWALSWPLLVSQLTQIALPLIDTVLIGRVSATALAGLAVAAPIYVVSTMVLLGWAVGIQILAARHHGAGEPAEVGRIAALGALLGAGLGVVVALGVVAVATPLTALLSADAASAAQAATYVQITAASLPVLAVGVALQAAYSGVGRTRIAMGAALIVATVNLAVGVVLVFGAGLGLAGAAFATVLARVAGAAFLVAWGLSRLRRQVPFTAPEVRSGARVTSLRVWRIAWPQVVLLTIGFASPVILVGLLSAQGATTVAGFRLLDNVFMVMFTATLACHGGVSILAGQRLGAGDIAGARDVQRAGMVLCLLIAAAVTTPLLVAPRAVLSLIAPNPDVVAAVVPAVWPTAAAMVPVALGAAISGVLRAAGDTRWIMFAQLAGEYGVVVVLTWLLTVRGDMGLMGLGIAWVAGWTAVLALYVLRYRQAAWETAQL